MRRSQTADIIADIDTFLSGAFDEKDRMRQDLDTLGATRLPAADLERMFVALGELRSLQADPVFWDRWRPSILVHEACELVGYEHHHSTPRDLMLFSARTMSGREGTLPRTQTYRDALSLMAPERPRLDTIETVFLHVDRGPDRAGWPTAPEDDPRCRLVREALAEIRTILDTDAPALPRLARTWQRAASIELPPREIDLDPDARGSADMKSVMNRIEPADQTGALASIILSWSIWSTGLVDRPVHMTAAALRRAPGQSPRGQSRGQTDDDQGLMDWIVRVITQSAERAARRARDARLAINVLEDRILSLGGRDRMRSVLFDMMIRNPIGTPSTIAAAGVSRKSALAFIDQMVGAGVCDWRGGRSSRIYEVRSLSDL